MSIFLEDGYTIRYRLCYFWVINVGKYSKHLGRFYNTYIYNLSSPWNRQLLGATFHLHNFMWENEPIRALPWRFSSKQIWSFDAWHGMGFQVWHPMLQQFTSTWCLLKRPTPIPCQTWLWNIMASKKKGVLLRVPWKYMKQINTPKIICACHAAEQLSILVSHVRILRC